MQTLADSADLYANVNDETSPNVSYVHFHGMSRIKAGNGGRGFKKRLVPTIRYAL